MLKILTIGHTSAGKTCYFDYARCLFETRGIVTYEKIKSGVNEKYSYNYGSRKSPITKQFRLPENSQRVLGGEEAKGTGGISEYDFKLDLANLTSFNGAFDPSVWKFMFVDVAGGTYAKFLENELNSDWNYDIKRNGHDDYNALFIVVDGKEFLSFCNNDEGYKIKNLIKSAEKVRKSKGDIPAVIIVTHANVNKLSSKQLTKGEILLVKRTVDRILKALDLTNELNYYFVDVEEPKEGDLNSHGLDTPLRQSGQIPFLRIMRDYALLELKSTPAPSIWQRIKSVALPHQSYKLKETIEAIDDLMGDVTRKYNKEINSWQ